MWRSAPYAAAVTFLHALAIFGAGVAAGTINTVVGSGTLVTFPVLLAFGYAPVTANVSNTIGLVPGSVAGALGYRRELRGQERRTARLAVASLAGGLLGAASAADAARVGVPRHRAGIHRARRRADRGSAADRPRRWPRAEPKPGPKRPSTLAR